MGEHNSPLSAPGRMAGPLNDDHDRGQILADTISRMPFSTPDDGGNVDDQNQRDGGRDREGVGTASATVTPAKSKVNKLSKLKGKMKSTHSQSGPAPVPAYQGAGEPVWTEEQSDEIQGRCAMTLDTISVTDTRRSIPDSARHLVRGRDGGTVMATTNSILPLLNMTVIELGMGVARGYGNLQQGKAYSDVVGLRDDLEQTPEDGQWQAREEDRGALREVRPPERRASGPSFETLNAKIPAIKDSLSITAGYYWTNASWGVNGNAGTFSWQDENGAPKRTQHLPTAMKMILGSSSSGVATIAISVSSDAKLVNGKMTSTGTGYSFSIKRHNMMHFDKQDYHGPPQSAATEFELSVEIMAMAKPLGKPAVSQLMLSGTASGFGAGSGAGNPFAMSAFLGKPHVGHNILTQLRI
ncbi:hypothetical protein EYC84_001944 [Monilinia fructicola]|nr:hypothetical protein EYC84_001944 [Monilinia fructicola]